MENVWLVALAYKSMQELLFGTRGARGGGGCDSPQLMTGYVSKKRQKSVFSDMQLRRRFSLKRRCFSCSIALKGYLVTKM